MSEKSEIGFDKALCAWGCSSVPSGEIKETLPAQPFFLLLESTQSFQMLGNNLLHKAESFEIAEGWNGAVLHKQ